MGRTYYKITVCDKVKIIDNKISDLSSGKVCKYEFLIGEDILTEKAAVITRFKYSPLGSSVSHREGGGRDMGAAPSPHPMTFFKTNPLKLIPTPLGHPHIKINHLPTEKQPSH